MALVPVATYGAFLWDKRTGEVLVDMKKTERVKELVDASMDLALEELSKGEFYVKRGFDFGGSIQVHDGRWLNGRSWAEVQVPCPATTDGYMQAGIIAGDLAELFAHSGEMILEERIEKLLREELLEEEGSR